MSTQKIKNCYRYIVMTASTTPSARCWGIYRRVAVVLIDTRITDYPKMISDRAKGVVEVMETWENLNVGKTERCAYQKAVKEACEMARTLNTERVL